MSNKRTLLYTLFGIILDIEEDYVRASIREGTERKTVRILDKPAFEKAGILEMGDPFFYQLYKSNNEVYGLVVSRDLDDDEKPSPIKPEIAELLDRLERKETEALKLTKIIAEE